MRYPPKIHLVDPMTGDVGRELIGLRDITWYNAPGAVVGGGSLEFSLRRHKPSVDAMTAMTEIAILIDGVWQTNSHVELSESGQQIITKKGKAVAKRWGFVSLLNRFAETLCIPTGARAKKRHEIGNPGEIFSKYWVEARARGCLEEFETRDWGDTDDSHNVPWDADNILDFYVTPGMTMLDLLKIFERERAAEFVIRKHLFRLFNYGTAADDYATPGPGKRKITLITGRDIQEGTRNVIGRGMANAAYAWGDDEKWEVSEDADSITEYKRRERSIPANGVSDRTALARIANKGRSAMARPIAYKSYTIPASTKPGTAPHPYAPNSYGYGDLVNVKDAVFNNYVGKAAGITLKWSFGKRPVFTLEIDGRFARIQDRLERGLDDMLAGIPGGKPPQDFRIKPSPPTWFDDDTPLSTELYIPPTSGETMARIMSKIILPTTKEDGDPLEDLDRIVWKYKYSGQKNYNTVDPNTPTDDDIEIVMLSPGRDTDVEVFSVTEAGIFSDPLGPVTITTAPDHGGFRTVDSTTGELLFSTRSGDRVDAPLRFTLGNVPGSAPEERSYGEMESLDFAPTATGPGVRFQETGTEMWDDAGNRSIFHDGTTGNAWYDGNVEVKGLVTVWGSRGAGSLLIKGDVTLEGDFDGGDAIVTGGQFLGASFTTDGDSITMIGDEIIFSATSTLFYDGTFDILVVEGSGLGLTGRLIAQEEIETNTNIFALGTINAWGGFAANHETPRGKFGVSTAATDLASVIVLANNLRLATHAFGLTED